MFAPTMIWRARTLFAGLLNSIPSVRLWRFTLRPPDTPRYEEQDIDALLRDLARS